MKIQDYVKLEKLAEKAKEIVEILQENGFISGITIDRWGDASAMIDCEAAPVFVKLEDVERNPERNEGFYYVTHKEGIEFWVIYRGSREVNHG